MNNGTGLQDDGGPFTFSPRLTPFNIANSSKNILTTSVDLEAVGSVNLLPQWFTEGRETPVLSHLQDEMDVDQMKGGLGRAEQAHYNSTKARAYLDRLQEIQEAYAVPEPQSQDSTVGKIVKTLFVKERAFTVDDGLVIHGPDYKSYPHPSSPLDPTVLTHFLLSAANDVDNYTFTTDTAARLEKILGDKVDASFPNLFRSIRAGRHVPTLLERNVHDGLGLAADFVYLWVISISVDAVDRVCEVLEALWELQGMETVGELNRLDEENGEEGERVFRKQESKDKGLYDWPLFLNLISQLGRLREKAESEGKSRLEPVCYAGFGKNPDRTFSHLLRRSGASKVLGWLLTALEILVKDGGKPLLGRLSPKRVFLQNDPITSSSYTVTVRFIAETFTSRLKAPLATRMQLESLVSVHARSSIARDGLNVVCCGPSSVPNLDLTSYLTFNQIPPSTPLLEVFNNPKIPPALVLHALSQTGFQATVDSEGRRAEKSLRRRGKERRNALQKEPKEWSDARRMKWEIDKRAQENEDKEFPDGRGKGFESKVVRTWEGVRRDSAPSPLVSYARHVRKSSDKTSIAEIFDSGAYVRLHQVHHCTAQRNQFGGPFGPWRSELVVSMPSSISSDPAWEDAIIEELPYRSVSSQGPLEKVLLLWIRGVAVAGTSDDPQFSFKLFTLDPIPSRRTHLGTIEIPPADKYSRHHSQKPSNAIWMQWAFASQLKALKEIQDLCS